MKTIYHSIIAFSLSAVLFSCGGSEQKTVTELPAVPVKVAKIAAGGAESFVTASGQVAAVKSANLSTRMMGYVSGVEAKVGEKVSQGELLLTVNNADLQAKRAQVEAAILQAKAGFANAEKDYNRFKTLYEQGSASEKEFDDMTTRYEMAKAGVQQAEQMKNEVDAQFKYANIRAPFDGVVTNTFVKAGDMANPGMPLVSIEAPSQKEVTAMVSESDIDAIKEGMDVKVLVKSLDKFFDGKVSEVSMSARNTGGQYLVKVDLQADESVLSGMFVNVQFPVQAGAKTEIVMVPTNALVQQGQLTGVYTVGEGNVAILRWLRTGKTFGNEVEVLSGLSANETYIVSADGKLFNGSKISF